jgi:hypothetical protein
LKASGRKRARPTIPWFVATPEPIVGMSAIAPQHYRSARVLLDLAEQVCEATKSEYCYYVPSALCLLHASLECHINEELGMSAGLAISKGAEEMAVTCIQLQNQTLDGQKIVAFLEAYGFSDRFEDEILQDAVALCGLRNHIYHHPAEMRPVNEYPEGIVKALIRADIPAVNTSWTAAASHIKIGRWARRATEMFVTRQHELKGWPLPFAEGPFSWNHYYDVPR